MVFKKGAGWKACFDSNKERYFSEYGGVQEYRLYEITKEIFNKLDKKMSESDATDIIHGGRCMYMAVNDRCGPPYTIVFDDDYAKLCPWADIINSGKIWPDELTNVAIELFEL